MTALAVAILSTLAAFGENFSPSSEAAVCMLEVLGKNPEALDVRIRVLSERSNVQFVVEYSFVDKENRHQDVRFPVVRDPSDQSLTYTLSQARAYEGPVTGEVIHEWLAKCEVDGNLVT